MFIALLLALLVTRFLQRQRLVVDEPAGASDTAHLPLRLKGVSSRLLRLAQPDIQKCSWTAPLNGAGMAAYRVNRFQAL